MRKSHLIFTAVVFLLLSSCQKDDFQLKNTSSTRAFFGDKERNSVVAIDVETMSLASVIATGHEVTYTADATMHSMGKVYAVNRGSDAIDVVDCDDLMITKTIDLEHHPRSCESVNEQFGLVAASGMDKPMVSIIDLMTDEVVAVVGDTTATYPVSHNKTGSHACGHPFWINEYYFVLLDRHAMTLSTWFVRKGDSGWKNIHVNTIKTPSPVHAIVHRNGYYQGDESIFYATAEGITKEGPNNRYPAILELKFTPFEGITQTRMLELVADGHDVSEMGLHHADFHPFEKLMYVGSKEGSLFVVNYETMTVEKTIQAGVGAGHTQMVPQKNLGVVINHSDVFVTIVDLETNSKITDVEVSLSYDLVGTTTIQAHPKYHVSEDGSKFYSFVSSDGVFYELDLNTLSVSNTLEVGGTPVQGSFVKM